MYNLSVNSLVRIELIKNKNWVNLALFVSILIFTYFNVSVFSCDNDSSLYQMYITKSNSILTAPIALIFIIGVGNEISKGNLSKNIIDGFSRSNFYIGKLYLAFIVSFFLVIFQLVVLAIIPIFNDLNTNIIIYTQISDIFFMFIGAFISCLVGIFFGILGGSSFYGIIAFSIYRLLFSSNILFTKDKIGISNYTLNDCLLSTLKAEPLAWSQVITLMIYVLIIIIASYKILLKKEL